MRATRLGATVATVALVLPAAGVGAPAAVAAPTLAVMASAQNAAAAASAAVATAAGRTQAQLALQRKPNDPSRTKRNGTARERVRAAAVANPTIPEICGIDATLTLDSSASIGSDANQVRTAANDFLQALKDTNSTLRIASFATRAKQLAPRSPVNATTTGPGGVLSEGVKAYPRPDGGTNWMEALDLTNSGDTTQPKLLIFVTDGDPTYWTNPNGSIGGSGIAQQPNINNSLSRAIPAADRVKGKNTRVLVVGVGKGLNNSASQGRMKDISGPQLVTSPQALVGKSINDVDAVAFTDFAALSAFLRSVVTSLCGNSVTVQKLAQSGADAQYLPATGWDMTVKPTVAGGIRWVEPDTAPAESKTAPTSGAQGTALFQWKPNNPSAQANVQVTESVKDGFNANRWECDIRKPGGTTTTVKGNLTGANPSFAFTMAAQDVAACRLINDFIYEPNMTVAKTARDNPVRGNNGGWTQTYDIVVTNTGNTPLAVATPVDPKCTSITGPTNSGGASRLAPGNSWNYVCTSHIETPTQTQAITWPNTVTVTGVPESGSPVVRTATAEVDVKTPAIQLVKTATRTDGTPIGDDPVPAGTTVIYVYTVTNTGNDVLKNVSVTDPKCAPISRVSGSGTQLAVGATWVYNCQTVLNPPARQSAVTNVGTVSADWSNPQNRTQNDAKVTDADSLTIRVMQSASLNLIKITDPGATDHGFDFTVTGQGVAPPDQSFTLNALDRPIRKIILDSPSPDGSTYTVTEAPDAAWDVTGITCSKAATVDPAAGTLSVVINPTEDVTCTYANGRRPHLTVAKQTVPASSPASFGFTAARPAPLPPLDPAAFTLTGGQDRDFEAVATGPVTITEDDIPAGWRLDHISCGTHPVTVTGNAATLDLAYGDDVLCTFSNAELAPASLTIVKSGTTTTASPDFPFTASGTGLVNPGEPDSDLFTLPIGDSTTYQVRPGESGNEYTVTEGTLPEPGPGQSGWDLTDIDCVVNDTVLPPFDPAGREAQVTLQPGDNATCTFTNQQRPRLAVDKRVVVGPGQTGGDTEFDFDATGLTPTTFTLGDGDTQAFDDLPNGTAVSVTETAIPDWSLTNLLCSGTGSDAITVDPQTLSLSGTLSYGADVTCGFVNTKDPSAPALLTVVKQVDPTIDAPAFDYDFSSDPADPAVEDFSLDPDAGGTASRQFTLAPVDLGTDYTITEEATQGWQNSELACVRNGTPAGTVTGSTVTLQLQPGDAATCTYTNQREGRLTIVKQESVRQGEIGGLTWDFTAGGVSPDAFSLTDQQSRTFSDIPVGTEVTIAEEAPDPDVWDTTIRCSGRGSDHYGVSGRQVTGTVQNADDVTCLYTNTRQPLEQAVLTVSKAVHPTEAGAEFDYDFSASDPDPAVEGFSLTTGADGTAARVFILSPFEEGTEYTLSEDANPAYDFSGLSCVVNGTPVPVPDATAVLDIDPGDTASCHYENTLKAQLTIAKEVQVGPGQTGADRRFSFSTTSLDPAQFDLGDGERQQFSELASGEEVSVDEPAVAEWRTDVTCAGLGVERFTVTGANVTGTPQAGDDVTCTYTNTKEPLRPALLGVFKGTDPSGSPTVFDFLAEGIGLFVVEDPGQDAFELSDAELQVYQVHPVEAGDDYTVTETVPAGWDLIDLICLRSDDPDNPIEGDLDTGTVTVPALLPGTVAFCGYENQQRGSLTITKHTDQATTTRFGFTAAGVTPGTFDLGGNESRAFSDLAPGTVATVNESVPSDPPDRWDLQDIVCAGNATPAVIDVGAGTVQVTVGAGEDVECVFTDAKVPTATIQVVKAADPAAGTSFDFTAAGSEGGVLPDDRAFALAPDGDVAVRQLVVHPPKQGETVTIAEDLVPRPDWHLVSLACAQAGVPTGLVSGSQVELPVQPGDTISCTFSNREDASLTVRKAAPDDPSVQFPFEWSLGDPFELADGGTVSEQGLEPGTYTVAELIDSESFPADWFLSDGTGQPFGTCVGAAEVVNGPESGSTALTIAAGEDVVCTFANFFDYRPGIQLDKTADRTVLLQGGTAVYGYALTNAGNVAIPYGGDKDDIVTDDMCAPVTYTGPDDDQLDPDEQWTFTCTSDALNQTTTNVGTATLPNPVDPDNPLIAADDEIVEVRIPALELDKLADRATVYPGTQVTYTYSLRNAGQTPFEGPADRNAWMVDDGCSPVTYVSGDVGDDSILDVDETWTYTCSSVLDTTTRNVATGTGTPFLPASPESGEKQTGSPMQATDDATVNVIVKDITVVKSASAPGGVMRDGVLVFPAGEDVTYTYDVTSGDATTPMQVVSMADDSCRPVTYRSGDTNGNGLVDPGETWRYDCKRTVTAAHRITNTVTVVATEPILGGASNSVDQAVVESFTSGIAVRKRPDRDVVPTGHTITYTYEVTNTGSGPLSDVTLTDDRCAPVSYRSGDANNDRILQVDEEWIYTCARVLEESVTNQVVARGTNVIGAHVSATATAAVVVLNPASLDARIRVAKTPSKSKVKKGKQVTYTYKVTNPGRVPLADVKKLISDNRCSPVDYVRGDIDGNNLLTSGKGLGEFPKETWIFTCTHKLKRTTTNTVRVGGVPFYDDEVMGPRVSSSAKANVKVAGDTNKHKKKKDHKKQHDDDGRHPHEDPSFTGAEIMRLLLFALLALAAGSALVWYSRRRRSL